MSFSASSETAPAQGAEERRRGRRVALLILALCAAPMVAAWLAYFVWPPQSRMNYGELVEPRELPDRELRGLRGKWVLLQVDSGVCSRACRGKLLYMRQARLALGKDADRVARVWLLSDAATPDPGLLREHEGLVVARVSGASLEGLAASGDPAKYIYLIDPRGTLMLRFPAEPDGRRMLRDLVRLLGASRIG